MRSVLICFSVVQLLSGGFSCSYMSIAKQTYDKEGLAEWGKIPSNIIGLNNSSSYAHFLVLELLKNSSVICQA